MFVVDKSEIVALENGLKRLKGKRYEDRKSLIYKLKAMSDSIDDIGVDFLIYDDRVMYCIERKTITDLISSVVSGRLWMQLQRLKEMENDFDGKFVPVLIIEGGDYILKRIMKDRYDRDWLLGVEVGEINLGVYVIRTNSLSETVKVLEKYKESVDGKRRNTVVFKRTRILNSEENEVYAVLCGVNGIGGVKARKLLSRFKTVKNVFNADKDELIEILGKKVGTHFYDIINKEIDVE